MKRVVLLVLCHAVSSAAWTVVGTSGLSAQELVINEILASNRLQSRDEDLDSPDWVEILNTGAEPVRLEGFSLSDDPRIADKWVFPDVVLPAGDFLVVWCSGKDRMSDLREAIEKPARSPPLRPTFIAAADRWKFLAGEVGDEVPEGWSQPGFDDAAWQEGLAPFGLKFEELGTELPADSSAVLLRKSFQVDDPEAFPNLVLDAAFNDGFAVYLNGERILDANVPPDEEPTFASRAILVMSGVQERRFDLTQHLGFLREGTNVLAVVVLNRIRRFGDLFFFGELGWIPSILHTSFALSSDGDEPVLLVDREGRLIDLVALSAQTPDRSYGRLPDGKGEFRYMVHPTPWSANTSFVSSEPIAGDVLVFDPPSGRQTKAVGVEIRSLVAHTGVEIRYTLDGSEPTREAALYGAPIPLDSDAVIRAAAFIDGVQVEAAPSKTYFGVSELSRELALPVLAIAMDPEVFEELQLDRLDRGRESERPATLEIFNDQGRVDLSTGFGMRLHGGAGRGGGIANKKAYRAYFRREYGVGRLHYPLIPDTELQDFDRVVLRANLNDSFRSTEKASLIRDQIIRDLHQDVGGVVSHGSWYNLFLNGEFRGVYNVVERLDKEFMASYFREIGENWDVMKTGDEVQDGETHEWARLVSFIRENDLSNDAVFDEGTGMVDIQDFTDYMLVNLWADNTDWPHNNWYAARPRLPDGRWIFMCWDSEIAFGLSRDFTGDTLDSIAGRGSTIGSLFAALLKNAGYREFFLRELDRHLSGALSADNVLAHIDRLENHIRTDIPEELRRERNEAVALWEANIESMRVFARNRGPVVREHILSNRQFPFPRVMSADPEQIILGTDEEVVLGGIRFTETTAVFFGDLPAPRVEYVSYWELRATLPPDERLLGFPSIRVVDPENGEYTTEGVLEVVLPAFRRGDADGDGKVRIIDALLIARHVTRATSATVCADAMDADDSGGLDVVDALMLLHHLFRPPSPAPSAPFPGCGLDPSPDSLSCEDATACAGAQ